MSSPTNSLPNSSSLGLTMSQFSNRSSDPEIQFLTRQLSKINHELQRLGERPNQPKALSCPFSDREIELRIQQALVIDQIQKRIAKIKAPKRVSQLLLPPNTTLNDLPPPQARALSKNLTPIDFARATVDQCLEISRQMIQSALFVLETRFPDRPLNSHTLSRKIL